jgi:hypothetical protein
MSVGKNFYQSNLNHQKNYKKNQINQSSSKSMLDEARITKKRIN